MIFRFALAFIEEFENFSPQVANKYGDGLIPIFPPPDFRAIDPNPFDIKLAWEAVDGAVRYNIYRDSQDVHIGTASGETTFTDDTVADALSHVYWVRASNGTHNSPFSAPALGYLTAE